MAKTNRLKTYFPVKNGDFPASKISKHLYITQPISGHCLHSLTSSQAAPRNSESRGLALTLRASRAHSNPHMSSWQARNPRPAGKPGADGFGFVAEKTRARNLGANIFWFGGGGIQNDTNIQPFAMTKAAFVAKKNSVCVCEPSTAGLFSVGVGGGTRFLKTSGLELEVSELVTRWGVFFVVGY